jgi:hypothetical protein
MLSKKMSGSCAGCTLAKAAEMMHFSAEVSATARFAVFRSRAKARKSLFQDQMRKRKKKKQKQPS